jgi:hypothetical protein
MQVVLIFKHEASVVFASFELAFSFHPANEAPPVPRHPDVIVDLKNAHSGASEIKNIIGNLLLLGLFEALFKSYTAFHELNQTIYDELGQSKLPNHSRFVCIRRFIMYIRGGLINDMALFLIE